MRDVPFELVKILHDPNLLRLLEAFKAPCTTAEAARKLGEPANRVGHRVHKLRRAGLLTEARRQGRKVFWQARSLEFTLQPSGELLAASLEHVDGLLEQLGTAIKKQIERRFLLGGEPSGLAPTQVSLQDRPGLEPVQPQIYLAAKPLSDSSRQRLQALTQHIQELVVRSDSNRQGPTTLVGVFVVELSD